MKRLTLSREDFSNPLQPNMWQEILEDFELPPGTQTITIKVHSVTAE